jgi:uncharacterized lipoprotein
MKQLYSLLAVIVLMTGCTYKNEAIELSPFKAQYLGRTTQDTNSISLLAVTDAREDKTSIGYVEANGYATTKLYSYVDFADKYREGLANVLKTAKFKLTNNAAEANTIISVKIKDIKMVYNDTNKFDENLHGKVVIEVTIKKADKTIVQTITQQQGIWIKPSYTSKDIEPLLYSIFIDSINLIGAKLAAQ